MREHIYKNPSQEVDKDSHPFRRDTASRDSRDENEILLKPARLIANEAYSDPADTKTLTSPSWSDDKGKIAVALLTKPEIGSF